MNQHFLNLETRIAIELDSHLKQTLLGSEFNLEPSGDFLSLLEYYIPLLLSHYYLEWEQEGLDGFYITSARKTAIEIAEIYGWAILLNEPGVTPFFIRLSIDSLRSLIKSCQLLLGEPGHGRLGITGKPGAGHLIETRNATLDDISWKYTVTGGDT